MLSIAISRPCPSHAFVPRVRPLLLSTRANIDKGSALSGLKPCLYTASHVQSARMRGVLICLPFRCCRPWTLRPLVQLVDSASFASVREPVFCVCRSGRDIVHLYVCRSGRLLKDAVSQKVASCFRPVDRALCEDQPMPRWGVVVICQEKPRPAG
jgi:hypothetical protein